MTIIYLDLFTTALFSLLIGYIVRFGLSKDTEHIPVTIQKLNQLFHHNCWLYVLPYFYTITLLTDFENLFSLKTYASQILFFLSILLFQVLIFLRFQPFSIIDYVGHLRINLKKFHLKFFHRNHKKGNIEAGNEAGNMDEFTCSNITITLKELTFLLNYFALPSIFILTNSYFFTKLIFLITNFL